jgi:hypothetical protein
VGTLSDWSISMVNVSAFATQCDSGSYGKETTGLRMMELLSNWPRRPFEQCAKNESTC